MANKTKPEAAAPDATIPDNLTVANTIIDSIKIAFPKYVDPAIDALLKKALGNADLLTVLQSTSPDEAWTKVQAEIQLRLKATPPAAANGNGGSAAPGAGGKSNIVTTQQAAQDFEEDPFAEPESSGFLRVLMTGPEGSGKTYTSLRVLTAYLKLKGIDKPKIAVIDTEKGSAAKYKKLFAFKHMIVTEPFHPQKLMDLIAAAEKFGYDGLICDSLSHFWKAPGGILDIHDAVTRSSKSGDSWGAWRSVTPIQEDMIQALTQANLDLFASTRTKVAYESSQGENGRMKIQKIGLAPIQRDDLPYEFDVVLDGIGGEFSASKTRCPGLQDKVMRYPGEEVAQILFDWLS